MPFLRELGFSGRPMMWSGTALGGCAREGERLVEVAVERARAAGCEWLHVDFEDHLRDFYFGARGFTPTNAGLIEL
jgi:hypothetical protein